MKANRNLGQHFLNDPRLLAQIAAAGNVAEDDVILEIGPGPGGLTEALLDTGATVIAIERDPRMGHLLQSRFMDRPFVLVEGDALELDWHGLTQPWTMLGKPLRVVGNIPYYITSPLLECALRVPLPKSITFLVQEEVANRLVARPDTAAFGALSVGIQSVATVTVPMKVGRGSFSPPPRVDSAVVHLVPLEQPLVDPEQGRALRRLTVDLFSYRRKKIHRALRQARGFDSERATAILAAAGINPELRPEAVDVAGFIRLFGEVASAGG